MNGSEHHPGDELRRVDRAKLQDLLVAYYRDLGWWVERATGDPGFDDAAWVLKRDRDILLLDCRHWDCVDRPPGAVPALVSDLARVGAHGGILVDRRPFTRGDHEAANRHGHVRLIDESGLVGMLGDLPDQELRPEAFVPPLPLQWALRPRPREARQPRRGNALWWLIALGGLVVFVLLVRALLARTADTAVPPPAWSPSRSERQAPVVELAPVRVPAPMRAQGMPDAVTVDGGRRSEQAMRLIEDSTPEM